MIISDDMLKRLNLYKSVLAEKKAGVMFHANMFYSPDKETNEMFCKQIAKMLVCEKNGECINCGACLKVESESNPDVIIFGNKTRFNTNDVEKILEEQSLKPMLCSCKVYVINNIDNATIQAQNKLLKVLEEPSNNVYFLLSAINLDAVLPTVKSRCKIRLIEPFKYDEMRQIFEANQYEVSKLLFSQSGGYIGKIADLVTGGDFEKSMRICESIVFDLKSSKEVLSFSSELANSKQSFVLRLSLLQMIYRNIMLVLLDKDIENSDSILLGKIETIKKEFTVEAIVEIINRIDMCKKQFDSNVNIGMIADGLLMKILEVKYLCKQK